MASVPKAAADWKLHLPFVTGEPNTINPPVADVAVSVTVEPLMPSDSPVSAMPLSLASMKMRPVPVDVCTYPKFTLISPPVPRTFARRVETCAQIIGRNAGCYGNPGRIVADGGTREEELTVRIGSRVRLTMPPVAEVPVSVTVTDDSPPVSPAFFVPFPFVSLNTDL